METTSPLSKILNIFSEPSSVYEEILQQEKNLMNWLLPVLLLSLIGIVFTFVVFTDPMIQAEMKEVQHKKLYEQVKKKEMSQEQYEKTLEYIPEPGSPIFLATGSLGSTVFVFLSVITVAFVMMMAGKVLFQITIPFYKYLEIIGMAFSIFILSGIITMLMIKIGGSMSQTPSAAFFLEKFEAGNFTHSLLKSLDVFSFWYLFVLSTGLSFAWKKPLATSATVVVICWLCYVFASSYISTIS